MSLDTITVFADTERECAEQFYERLKQAEIILGPLTIVEQDEKPVETGRGSWRMSARVRGIDQEEEKEVDW